MSSGDSWTDTRVETLTKLWRDGLSASQIARTLGGVTRNAVIGKVHRLGLSGRASPSAPGPRRARPKGEPRPRPRVATPRRAVVDAPRAPAAEPPPPTGFATVVSVRFGQCRWPIGDPFEAGFCLCGRKAVRGAYCAPHGALAYRRPPRDHLLGLAGLR
jgi:GcrA cell cycle regulator